MGFWEPLFFWIFAVGALLTSFAVIVVRNPLYCALILIADFFCFAGLYVLLSAHFLAVVQMLVYGGAIMVLFLFIIMLLEQRGTDLLPNRFQVHYLIAVAAGVVMLLFAGGVILSAVDIDNVQDQRECLTVLEDVEEPDELADAQRERYDECEQQLGEDAADRPRRIATDIDGLYADVEEKTVLLEYQRKLEAWDQTPARPADGKYPLFDPDREFEMPPSLKPDPEEHQVSPGRAASRPDVDDQQVVRGNLFGTFKPISLKLVNRFVIPFELTAVLLLAAIVGAVLLAKRRVA